MEERILKCPNCGANASNHNNCEYCGSLLVRFVEKGIDLSNTSYTSNIEVFPGLIKELEQNLSLQKQRDKCTATDIYRPVEKSGNTVGNILSIIGTGKCTWADGQDLVLSKSDKGLVIDLRFDTYVHADNTEVVDFNKEEERQEALFKQLACCDLFTSRRCFYKDDAGDERKGVEYAIDFGEDVEGAARLISEILIKVYEIPLDEGLEFYTNYGTFAINKSRKQVAASRGFNTGSAWYYWVAGIIFLLWWLFS